MNKLLGAMVLLFGITTAAVTGNAAVDIDKMSKALNAQDSHIQQIAQLDENQLSQLCEEIADNTNYGSNLKSSLLQECKIKLYSAQGDIAEQIKQLIDYKE